ncbi:hypothetical protein ACE7GA_10190 [Roseomonas sp. CCTCC AB2023176]|uniref:hypothetical protein n=1 Tax=Roseomonas sp. CCTCC AB2023176 TaxID=3342640 RepID=UPI0035E35358
MNIVLPEGEINFIVASRLTKPHALPEVVADPPVMVEMPLEILAKKVFYRAKDFTPATSSISPS